MSENITRSHRIDPEFYHAMKNYANDTNQSLSDALNFFAKAFAYAMVKSDPLARKLLGKYFNPIESFSLKKSVRIALKSVDKSAFRVNLNEVTSLEELDELETSFLGFVDKIRNRRNQLKGNSP